MGPSKSMVVLMHQILNCSASDVNNGASCPRYIPTTAIDTVTERVSGRVAALFEKRDGAVALDQVAPDLIAISRAVSA